MARTSQKKTLKNTTNGGNGDIINNGGCSSVGKVKKRTRKSVPRDFPPRRSSVFRGVTRHRWTGRYEAHLWDKNCWNEAQNKKGRQVYLGAYDEEEAAAHAYDLAALKYWGQETILNFPPSTYEEELKEMGGQSKEEYIGSLRRKSSGFSRGVSKYRGVARHHHNGRWEARIGRVFGNKYLYLGTYATQEEAATAYDMAAIEYRGLNAVTNFDLSRYIKWLRPNQTEPSLIPMQNPNYQTCPPQNPNPAHDNDHDHELGLSFLQHQHGPEAAGPAPSQALSGGGGGGGGGNGGGGASSALGLLWQSSKFKEMLERTSSADCSLTAPPDRIAVETPRRSFPSDIQTYFDCDQELNSYGESDDIIFGDLKFSFSSPMFHCELDT